MYKYLQVSECSPVHWQQQSQLTSTGNNSINKFHIRCTYKILCMSFEQLHSLKISIVFIHLHTASKEDKCYLNKMPMGHIVPLSSNNHNDNRLSFMESYL